MGATDLQGLLKFKHWFCHVLPLIVAYTDTNSATKSHGPSTSHGKLLTERSSDSPETARIRPRQKFARNYDLRTRAKAKENACA